MYRNIQGNNRHGTWINTTDTEMAHYTVRSSQGTQMEKGFGLLRQDLKKKQHTDTQSCKTDLLHSWRCGREGEGRDEPENVRALVDYG